MWPKTALLRADCHLYLFNEKPTPHDHAFRELPLFELTATGTNSKQIPHCMNSETEVPDPAPEIRGAGRQ